MNNKTSLDIIAFIALIFGIILIVGAGFIWLASSGALTPIQPVNASAALPSATSSPVPPTKTPFRPLPTFTPSPSPTETPTATFTPTSTETPLPTDTAIPMVESGPVDSAYISNIWGRTQYYGLDCEARSAVDWARYFGQEIDEFDFLNQLPRSDNPEVGFVGSPSGYGGQIPPNDYGVHAAPVASLLRSYGVDARAVKGISLDDLKRQLSAGNPVIVWVIAGVGYSYPVEYTASDGETTIVSPNEHTVIAIGYDAGSITVLDGGSIYAVSTNRFMASWGVLGNMAVLYGTE